METVGVLTYRKRAESHTLRPAVTSEVLILLHSGLALISSKGDIRKAPLSHRALPLARLPLSPIHSLSHAQQKPKSMSVPLKQVINREL